MSDIGLVRVGMREGRERGGGGMSTESEKKREIKRFDRRKPKQLK